MPTLKVKNLNKMYGSLKAVDDISFSVEPGEILGLLGPNGAGKSSTITMIMGLLEPDSGVVEIFGKDLAKQRTEVLKQVNFAAVYAELPANLTIRQNLTIFAMLYGVSNYHERIEHLIDEYDLSGLADTRAGLLSSGEKSRLHLAKALLNEPRLLLLDEPTASLDPSASQIIRERFKNYAKDMGASILWTAHDMNEIELVCDRVMFISHGKILIEGDPKTLPSHHGKKNLEELFISIAREPLNAGEQL